MKYLAIVVAVISLTGSTANASTYDYNVDFDVGPLTITGTIVTACDNCPLDPVHGALVSWSFTSSDGVSMTSSDPSVVIFASPVYPLTVMPNSVIFDAAGPPGSIQFTDTSAILLFQAAYVDAPSEIYYDELPGNANSYTIIYVINDFTGSPPSAVQIATATPLPAALPLFAAGLGAMGLLGWRRKRKAQTVAA